MNLTRFQHYIDGAFVDAETTFESIDPSTGAPWALMPAASKADVVRAIEAADRAFHDPVWAGMTATSRGKLLMKLAARHRQDYPRDARADRLRCGVLPLFRRPRRQDPGRAPADRQAGHGGLLPPRTDRRRRRHHPLELPALSFRDEDRAGARRRLHHCGQGVGRRSGLIARLCAARTRGRLPGWRRQYLQRIRRSSGPYPHQPPENFPRRLHRRPFDCPPHRTQHRGKSRSCDARTRWEVACHRVRRRRS